MRAPIFALLLSLAVAQPVLACKGPFYEPPTERSRFKKASVVFTGQLLSIRPSHIKEIPHLPVSDYYELQMAVKKWEKGSGKHHVALIDHRWIDCGSSKNDEHIVPYKGKEFEGLLGRQWRVFAKKHGDALIVMHANEISKR